MRHSLYGLCFVGFAVLHPSSALQVLYRANTWGKSAPPPQPPVSAMTSIIILPGYTSRGLVAPGSAAAETDQGTLPSTGATGPNRPGRG
ncbi:hypothetical protein N7513_007854 [Penicillium frequentans]|nr:hypothetical protein N7513_007854 [Penicillium glabrum]